MYPKQGSSISNRSAMYSNDNGLLPLPATTSVGAVVIVAAVVVIAGSVSVSVVKGGGDGGGDSWQ